MTHSDAASPDSATAAPQPTIATVSATPCRRTRPIQPEDSPPITAPIEIAANSQPTADGPPNRSSATSGNSARGIANTIAMMSTPNDISSTGRAAMNRSPSMTERRPGRGRCAPRASGGQRRQPERRVERDGEQQRVGGVRDGEAAALRDEHAGAAAGRRPCPRW